MLPIARRMATVALVAVTADMFIIVFVALVTGGAEFLAEELSGMAGVATHGAMGAGQLITRIPVVIEDDFFPAPLVMALFALISVKAGVNIVDAMAGDALPGQIFVTFIGVATVARRLFMLSVQGELGLVMIETAGLPGLDAMTLVAGRTQPFFMRIILVMAIIARAGRVAVFGALFVTGRTGEP